MSITDWTRSETISKPDIITISWTTDATNTLPAQEKKVSLSSTTKGSSTSRYETLSYVDASGKTNTQDVVTYKEDIKETTKASVNQSWITDRLKRGRELPPGTDLERSVTTYEYRTSTDGPKLIKETTEVYISMAAFTGQMQGIPYSMVDPQSSSGNDYIYYDPPSAGEVLSTRTIVEYEEAKGADGRDYTRTKTSRWMALGMVTEAKESLLGFLRAVKDAGLLTAELIDDRIYSHTELKFDGTDVQVNIGRAPVPAKPSDAELAGNEIINGSINNSSLTPTEKYGNDLGWTNFVPDSTDWRNLTGDSNGDGIPDWADYVPDTWEDYNQDSNNDGTPDWADYVPGDWQDYDQDTDGDGIPDWVEYVPIGWEEFDTGDSDYSNPDAEVNNDRFITGRVVFDGQSYSNDATVTTTYDMPFAPDDYFYYEKSIRKLYSSGAEQAAIRFGQAESALDIGHAFGQNIVTNFDNTPTLDLSPVYVRLAGIEGAFLLDGTSYAWGPEGMVVSSDLMLIGVTGYDGASAPANSWLRLPVASTSIGPAGGTTVEASPAKANSIAIPGGFDIRSPGATLAALPTNGTDVFREWRDNTFIVPPSLVQEQLEVATGPAITLREFSYALTLAPEIGSVATGPAVDFLWSTRVAPPAGAVAIAGQLPRIATGVRVLVPATSVAVAGVAPGVASGASVVVPAAGIGAAGVAPDMVGRLRKEVFIPAADITMAALVPGVFSGGSIAVPAVDVALAGAVPVIGESDRYWSNVSLLLHMDGSNNSTTFTDSSSAARAITRSGDAKISTSQSKFGGASAAFDGSGDTLSTGSYSFAGSSDFTIELWVYVSSLSNKTGYIDVSNLIVYTDASSSTLRVWHGGAVLTGGTLPTSQWVHIAITRQGTTGRLFIDGTVVATNTSYSASITSGVTYLGSEDGNSNFLNGFIDEVRLTQNVARYTANFTPPTAAFPDTGPTVPTDPNFSSVSLLLHMDGSNGSTTFIDSSSNGHAMSIERGTVTITTADSKFGGASADFTAGGSLVTPTSSTFTFNANFTVELWVKRTSTSGGFDTILTAQSESSFMIRPDGLNPGVYINSVLFANSLSLTTNVWHHLAIVRNGSTVTAYKDGVSVGSATNSDTVTCNFMRLGDSNVSGRYFRGRIDEVRITKGIARYTANFTPPTAAFPDA